MARVDLHVFWVNQCQNIDIWGKISEGPCTKRDACLVVGTIAPRGGDRGPLGWGPLNIWPQNFVFGALFGPNEVLEMHLGSLLNQLSELE